ncbi:MAG: hypothetical protein QM831_36925 [Kofleriaceae bacterium]
MKSLVVIAVLAAPAYAYRPFDGTDADVAAEGDVELEIGPVIGERDSGTVHYTPGFVFNFGFAHGYELVIDMDLLPDYFASDVMIKKVLLDGSLQGRRGPSIALETGPLLPGTSDRQRDIGWAGNVIISQRWDALAIHLNGGVMYGRDRVITPTANLIFEGPDTWLVRPVAELAVEDRTTGLVGAIWRATDTLAIDAAIFAGRHDEGIRAGLTWVFPT